MVNMAQKKVPDKLTLNPPICAFHARQLQVQDDF